MSCSKKKIENLAYQIKAYLQEISDTDYRIYFDGVYICDKDDKTHEDSPANYMESYNLDTITMSFEGMFYEIINYDEMPSLLEKFNKLITKYGFYYDQCNAWNLALYEE